ncbi:MAG: tRNA uridine-5-carboxymethylaminomethyl(34) synthesis GTPase MnmE [Bacteroidetes bacterium]|nr:tRNA uridine-5-carboxymethylaminomethyl(34) synthesis GTPase MnmE [Bacteroidota bacterium]MCL6102568.1 tRNA uridine-5-carboxymethylaminomethyl(34) synthesis GTPase MnmE [Bacteroidota bacterium]
MLVSSTIAAISTPAGTGGIAVIRLSGHGAIPLTDRIFQAPGKGKKLIDQAANTLHFGSVYKGKELLDEVVVGLFRAPHSYTGEDVVEISCHGSLFVQQQILQLLLDEGAELAQPGEFTQRAFLNGKIDLSQAEAVADLIASGNSAAHRVALNQMRGGFSAEISLLRDQLLHFTSLVELELDFSEEDVEFADRTLLIELSRKIETLIRKLTESFKLGNALKNGIPVAIVGETNVGKSTLLNALLNEEKAIVSDIHGTTRDVIEDVVNLNGVLFRFFDTAGLRHTTDTIENLGIERSYRKLEQASIVLLVLDLTSTTETLLTRIEKIRKKITDQQLILVANKSDLVSEEVRKNLAAIPLKKNESLVFISAKSKANLTGLIQQMQALLSIEKVNPEDVIVTNLRHYEALTKALEAIERVITGLQSNISGEFLSQDIRECLYYLGAITGQITTDEVLGNIFKHFCIGK